MRNCSCSSLASVALSPLSRTAGPPRFRFASAGVFPESSLNPTFTWRNVDNILRSQRSCIVGNARLAVFESVEKMGPPSRRALPTILVARSSPEERIMQEIPFGFPSCPIMGLSCYEAWTLIGEFGSIVYLSYFCSYLYLCRCPESLCRAAGWSRRRCGSEFESYNLLLSVTGCGPSRDAFRPASYSDPS